MAIAPVSFASSIHVNNLNVTHSRGRWYKALRWRGRKRPCAAGEVSGQRRTLFTRVRNGPVVIPYSMTPLIPSSCGSKLRLGYPSESESARSLNGRRLVSVPSQPPTPLTYLPSNNQYKYNNRGRQSQSRATCSSFSLVFHESHGYMQFRPEWGGTCDLCPSRGYATVAEFRRRFSSINVRVDVCALISVSN